MTTVLEYRTWEGFLIGRCDAKCHTAKGKKCKCVCEGRNHGVGFDQAMRNEDSEEIHMERGPTHAFAQHQKGLFTPEKEQEPL